MWVVSFVGLLSIIRFSIFPCLVAQCQLCGHAVAILHEKFNFLQKFSLCGAAVRVRAGGPGRDADLK